MKSDHKKFSLMRFLQNQVEAWGSIIRFLEGLKSNSDFDGFFSRKSERDVLSRDRPRVGPGPSARTGGEIPKSPGTKHRRLHV
jgi:hypothetical protein